MDTETISARIMLSEYTNKVINIIKIKFGLKDKSEAINKFVEIYGDDIIEKEADESYVKKVITIADDYFKKNKNRKMSLKELDNLCGV